MSQSECSAPICSVRWGENGLGASGVAQDEWEVLMRGDEGGGEIEPKSQQSYSIPPHTSQTHTAVRRELH